MCACIPVYLAKLAWKSWTLVFKAYAAFWKHDLLAAQLLAATSTSYTHATVDVRVICNITLCCAWAAASVAQEFHYKVCRQAQQAEAASAEEILRGTHQEDYQQNRKGYSATWLPNMCV